MPRSSAKRDEFASAVQEIVIHDLSHNGLTLESVTISSLDQTDPTQLQERNVFDAGGQRAGTFICYESIFPDEIREFAANGAQVLVNISNDGWFGEHGMAGQLAETVWWYQDSRGYHTEALVTQRHALAAARAREDRAGEASALHHLGTFLGFRNRPTGGPEPLQRRAGADFEYHVQILRAWIYRPRDIDR